MGVRCIGFMQLGSAISYRFQRIKDGWQHFVVYINQAKSLFCNGWRFGGDKSHPISHVTYTIVQ